MVSLLPKVHNKHRGAKFQKKKISCPNQTGHPHFLALPVGFQILRKQVFKAYAKSQCNIKQSMDSPLYLHMQHQLTNVVEFNQVYTPLSIGSSIKLCSKINYKVLSSSSPSLESPTRNLNGS